MKKKNPLFPIITDLQYSELQKLKVFDETELRNIRIRAKFTELKKHSDMNVSDVIVEINKDYTYLGYDAIYNIVYRHQGKAKNEAKKSVEMILINTNQII